MAAPVTEAALRRMPRKAYMDARQRAFFQARLEDLHGATEARLARQREALRSVGREADELDLASEEERRRQTLRFMEREAALLEKVQAALRRLRRGEYGYCRESGEPIGIERLLARPTAEYVVEVKRRQESRERHFHKARQF